MNHLIIMTFLNKLGVNKFRMAQSCMCRCMENNVRPGEVGTCLVIRQISRVELRRWKTTEAQLRVSRPKTEVVKKITPWGYLLLAIPVSTFCLGTWQVQRRKWKLALIADLEERSNLPAVDLPESLNLLKHLEYRSIRVRGHFDHEREQYLGPRSLIVDGDAQSQGGIMSQGNTGPGYQVITPFKLADRDLTILVNRGWVPMNKVDPKTRQNGQVTGNIELIGVLRHNETRAPFVPNNNPQSLKVHYRDLDLMSQRVGAAPVFLDADVSSTVSGGPVGGQTKIALRNEHFSYIVTWYLLSAITSFMWYRQHIRGLPLI